MSIKTKGVAFNLECPHQRGLKEWADRFTNFSSYVKHLINEDKKQFEESERRNARTNDDTIRIKVD